MEEHKVPDKVPESPTTPGKEIQSRKFDIADLYNSPVKTEDETGRSRIKTGCKTD